MSDDKLLARIAAMESELAGYRARPKQQQEDPTQALVRALASDPVGTMTRLGIPVDHTTKVLVAHALGDQAPPELKVLAALGPQVTATNALQSELAATRQRLEQLEQSASRQSFKAVATDKSKYPHLAKALTADPALFDAEVAQGVSAEDLEARLARVAKVINPAASTENAEQKDQSAQVQAEVASIDPTPPPIPKPSGLFTPEEHQSLRDEIVRKYTPPARG